MRLLRTTKLAVAGMFLLVVAAAVFAQQAFNLNLFFEPSNATELLLLNSLSVLLFLVLLVFGFILLREIIKVLVEWKQEKPGSRFKTSLLISLVSLSLVPTVSVVAYAYGLMNRSMDKWFSLPVDKIVDDAGNMVESWQAYRDALEVMDRNILARLAASPHVDLAEARQSYLLRGVMRIDASGHVESSAEAGVDAALLARTVSDALGSDAEAFLKLESPDLQHRQYWVGGRRISTPQGPATLAVVFAAPGEDAAEIMKRIAESKKSYDEIIVYQRKFKSIYLALLALMTVLVLFAAVWVGLFLSKRITVPIEALSVATREISSGNLHYRVAEKADHELGMLITHFNDMAGRLEETTHELEARRRYMEVILESVPTGVISLDADLQIQTLNRAARKMFSIGDAAELKQVFEGRDLLAVSALIDELGEDAITREIKFTAPGRPAHSAVTASRLSGGGFVLVVEDLSEVVRAQKATAWREVARRLAHEIRNPLTPIQLSAERIVRNIQRPPAVAPRMATVIRECVGTIMDEVAGLQHLVDEFVRFARLPTVARLPSSMRELVERTLALYEGRMEGVSVTVDVPASLPLVLMDAMEMKRVLMNLIDNALAAMSGEPERALHFNGDVAREGTMVRLVIEDTGRGITPEDRERLFMPYFSTRKEGTGLGLAICSRIVADHGGYIGVESRSPRGTRFMIELPVSSEVSFASKPGAGGEGVAESSSPATPVSRDRRG